MFEDFWSWLHEPHIVNRIRIFGDYLRWAIALVALGIAILREPQLILPTFLSIVVAQLLVEGMKAVMNYTPWGDRPDGGDDGFPSGHVAGAFSGAWFFYFVYGWQIALIPVALGAFTALSRVLPRKHSWVQVSVSAVLTYFVSMFFLA